MSKTWEWNNLTYQGSCCAHLKGKNPRSLVGVSMAGESSRPQGSNIRMEILYSVYGVWCMDTFRIFFVLGIDRKNDK